MFLDFIKNIIVSLSVGKRYVLFMFIFCSCVGSGGYTPKPTGYLRIELPAAQYVTIDEAELPYTFSVSMQSVVELPPTDSAAYWMNISYPGFGAKIYCSYKNISEGTLNELTEECFNLAERAAGNGATITEKSFENAENKVYGTVFLIEDESASPIQFMLTDSITHFFRGTLYYKNKSNADSIAPITDYIRKDITELIQTFYWKQ